MLCVRSLNLIPVVVERSRRGARGRRDGAPGRAGRRCPESSGIAPRVENRRGFFLFLAPFLSFSFLLLPGAVIRLLSLARLQRQVRVVNPSSPLSQPPGQEEEEEEEKGSGVSCSPGPGRASLGRGWGSGSAAGAEWRRGVLRTPLSGREEEVWRSNRCPEL